MNVLALCLVLLAPPAPTLGDALRAIGAFEPAVDESLLAPPPPPRTGAKILLGTGAAMVVAGVLGMVFSPGCATRDAAGRCVDARGSEPIYPSLIVLGLGATATGSYWYRRDVE